MIFSILFAFLIIILSIFSLGNFIVGKLLPEVKPGEKILIGAFLGFSINASLMAMMGLIIGTSAYWLLIITSVFGFLNFGDFKNNLLVFYQDASKHKSLVLFSVLAAFSIAGTIIFSGIVRNGQLEFQEIHDSIWHIALIKELKADFPPAHPSFNQIKLTQYHYFYDLIIAGISNISLAPVMVLFFQVFPIILAILLIGSACALGWRLNKKHGSFWLIFLTAFAGSFAYLIPVFIKGNSWSESSFWVSQTFVMMVNPQVILTLGLTYTVMLIAFRSRPLAWKDHLLLILLIAPSIGFKSYSWVILSVVYAAILGWDFFTKRKKKWLTVLYGIIYSLVSLPFVWLVTGFKSGSFIYLPLWYLSSMVEISDRLNLVEWYLREEHYKSKGNWPRVWEIKIKELLIFYFGNLGVRSVFLGLLPVVLLKKLTKKEIRFVLICLVGFLIATIFPLIFLQRGVVWNSIQFWYYGLIFANILAALILSKITNRQNLSENIFFVFLIVLIAVPTYLRTINQKISTREKVDLGIMNTLSAYSENDKIMICHEGTIFYDSSFVSAISPAKVYLANPGQLELVDASMEPAKHLQRTFESMDAEKIMEIIFANKINKIICSDDNRNITLQKMVDNYQDYNFEIKNYGKVKIYNLEIN